jgi:hypothetical protein
MDILFPVAPAGKFSMILGIPIMLLSLALLVFTVLTMTQIGRGSVRVSSQEMKIKIPIYGRSVLLTSLILESARIVDLKVEKSLRPTLRTNGIGLPNYSSGWFKLKNGEKALAVLTDNHKVLYIPTRDGYSILISPMDPDALLDELKKQAHR